MFPTISHELLRLIDETEAFVHSRDDAWAVPRTTGEFLHLLILSSNLRRGIEIGTSYGFSGLWLGTAFRRTGGTLLTLDTNPAKTSHARQLFAKAGLSGVIRAETIDVEQVKDERGFDFAFIDADKASSVRYFEQLRPLLAPRATIIADNILSHEAAMAPYVQHVRAQPDFASALAPIGSGLEITVRIH